jgi:PAS domain S-box-containing protein
MTEYSLDGNPSSPDATMHTGNIGALSVHSLRALLTTVPGVVWEAWGQPDAATQRINYVSDSVERMMGYSVDEWLSTPNFWLKIVHPEDQERAAQESNAVFHSGGSGIVTFRWITRDGRILWVDAHSSVILDEHGKPAGMRGVTLDVTARKTAEIALMENQARIALLFRRLREAVLQTQDRIGNNLQYIASLLEEQILEHTATVPIPDLRQVQQRLGMLAEVQTIVTQAFREHADMDRIPAHQILDVLPNWYSLEVRHRPLKIETEEVYLSAARANSLAILASELISNAYRYGRGAVTVTMTVTNQQVVLTVGDEGDGFPPNFAPHEGMNTGLNLVRSLAWSGLGGTVRFENQMSGGACVTLLFPLNGF